MNRKINALTALLGLTLTLAAQAVAPAPRTISGTVTAAGGHSLKDTVIIACPQGDCDSDDVKGVVIGSEGTTATFSIAVADVEYALYAVQDNDGDEDVSAGDWVDRNLMEEKAAALVRAGAADVRLELVEVRRAP